MSPKCRPMEESRASVTSSRHLEVGPLIMTNRDYPLPAVISCYLLRHATAVTSATGHQSHLWGYAPAYRRGAGRCGWRPDLSGGSQRLGKIDLAAHCRQVGTARCRLSLRPA